jgi:hypothetical protein
LILGEVRITDRTRAAAYGSAHRSAHAFALVVALGVVAGCTKTTPPARAARIESRAELIGGKRALADIGDFKLSNGLVHAIVQDVGTSRGFGAFGGSLIDVDLVRSGPSNAATGAVGNDYFTEMFPAFFLTAIEPAKVEVLEDGHLGGAAIIRVSGHSSNFISLVKPITDLANPAQPLDYTCDYILEPGKSYLKIVTTIVNPSDSDATWGLNIPFGFVTLLGEGQRLFVPGEAGFDMRFHLDDTVYKRKGSLDALPGEVTQMWSTAGDGVSYALVPGRQNDATYLENKPEFYPTATRDSMLLPIASSSFLGSFWAKAPSSLPAKGTYSYSAFLAVGSGDVASAQRVIYELRDVVTRGNGREVVVREKTPYGTLSGLVRERQTLRPLTGVSVVLQNEVGEYVSQAQTSRDGRWTAPVPPGKYRAHAVDSHRAVPEPTGLLEVAEGGAARLDVELDEPGDLRVAVRDETGRALPAKISVEAISDNDVAGRLPRHFLFNLKIGDRFRPSDFVPDEPSRAETQKYLERVFFATDGRGGTALRPGRYRVYASRGIEYDLQQKDVDIEAGKTAELGFTLTHVMPTPGWVSGDFHVHSVKSVDSDMSLPDRVASYAVEGVDLVASTDHNYVSDFGPAIDALQLGDFVHSVVGLELTSLEMGHFNAFPVNVQPGPVQHGSFRWFFRPPGELFAQLRGLGRDAQQTLIQVNHPRDTILGYFNAFNVGTYTGAPIPAVSNFTPDTSAQADGTPSPYDARNFSLDFDIIEIFNGKRQDLLTSYTMPRTAPPGDEPKVPRCGPSGATTEDCIPAAGEVLERVVKVEKAGAPAQYLQQPAFPGALDDWYTLLGRGRRLGGTANSDSHGDKAEAGMPRTYVQVGGSSAEGSMRALDEDEVFRAMRAGKMVGTNGPFVEVTVNGQGLGSTVVASDGVIELSVVVKAAPWVDVRRVVVRRGGRDQQKRPFVLDTFEVDANERGLVRLDVTRTYAGIPDGSFIVVEASGEASMYPVFTPTEVPSLQISDAVGVIGDSFGFAPVYGKYEPMRQAPVTPFAVTNPIFVDRTPKQQLKRAKTVLPVSNDRAYTPRVMPDLRVLYHAFHSDP